MVLTLLAHDASPHLINCHGQRCYEMVQGGREVKARMEGIIKGIWQDLRKIKETQMDEARGMGGGKGKGRGEGVKASRGSWSEERGVMGLSQRVDTPILTKALQWNEEEKERERAEERVRTEQLRREAADAQSLVALLDQRMTQQEAALTERKQRRKGARQGGEEAARLRTTLMAEEAQWKEAERVKREGGKAEEERVAHLYHRMRRVECLGRVHEVRAVMKECETEREKGKRGRVLRQMKRNTTWMIGEQIKQDRAEAKRRLSQEGVEGVFMTELEGQEGEPLPQAEDEKEGEEGGRVR